MATRVSKFTYGPMSPYRTFAFANGYPWAPSRCKSYVSERTRRRGSVAIWRRAPHNKGPSSTWQRWSKLRLRRRLLLLSRSDGTTRQGSSSALPSAVLIRCPVCVAQFVCPSIGSVGPLSRVRASSSALPLGSVGPLARVRAVRQPYHR